VEWVASDGWQEKTDPSSWSRNEAIGFALDREARDVAVRIFRSKWKPSECSELSEDLGKH